MTALPQLQPWALPRTTTAGRRLLAAAWPACVLAALFALLAWRSWGTWPDPLIDFGRELYVPWRMAEGDVLYRDIAYFNGPLSPAFNALWFSLVGASLQTLVGVNLAIAVATTAVLYWILRQICNRPAATIACAAFLALFAFSQFTPIRNYNFVCPYSHEMTHGLLLAMLALAVAWQVERWGYVAAALAGGLLGLVLLTKVELAVAAAVAVFASLVVLMSRGAVSPKRPNSKFGETRSLGGVLAICIGIAVAAAVVPPLIAMGLLSRSMPMSDAVAGCFGAWNMAAAAEIRELDFYRRGLGTLDVGESLALMATSVARWVVLLGAAFGLMRVCTNAMTPYRRAGSAAPGGVLAVYLLIVRFSWPLMERALPALLAILIGWNAREALRPAIDATTRRQSALRTLWCVFALAMLAKIALCARISHYGFVLAVPALAAVAAALFDWLPSAARRRGLPGDVLICFAAPLVVAYVLAYQAQQSVLVDRTTRLGSGTDQFAAAADAEPVGVAERVILERVAPEDTLAVLPEGVMLNYLTRRKAPTKFITYMPPELYHFGEAKMLSALHASQPDWVLLAPRDMTEYGVPPFGAGYADAIARWMDANYVLDAAWSAERSAPDSPSWRLLKRSRHASGR
jgi:hypothetical protein